MYDAQVADETLRQINRFYVIDRAALPARVVNSRLIMRPYLDIAEGHRAVVALE
jgi:hypothetical protein